ncbi:hypothetical protein FH972_017834 [Carpinus fangiana]|uniref:Uncharacterized protein n=1 Tax=Carpinus fangiana TaxID=176857 RepID=A0A5N6RP16_9ROSI|nr:hypothetical protein FH972_017834 [Carpinus fangiana]
MKPNFSEVLVCPQMWSEGLPHECLMLLGHGTSFVDIRGCVHQEPYSIHMNWKFMLLVLVSNGT